MISNYVLEKLEFSKVLQYISKYASTENGKKIITDLKPLANSEVAKIEGELVTQAKEILIKNFSPPIDYIPDIEEQILKSKIEGSVLDVKKIIEILKLAVISRNLFQFLKNNNEIAKSLIGPANKLFIDKVFEHHIQRVITENGEIKESASTKLKEIKNDIKRKSDELLKSVNRIMKSLSDQSIVREDYLTLRDGRIVIPIKVEHKRHIRGFIHSESSTGQTVYIEPEETLELNNELVTLYFAEKREVERILKELTKLIGKYSDLLLVSLNTVAYIDSVFARAKYSLEIIGSFPTINPKQEFILEDARHPILLKRMGRDKTIPLNITINENRIIVLTGPNAGGKTVVLKTMGLLCIMVQSGIHIPVSPDSNVRYFNKILVDIGDEQSLEDDLSTFSSHLSNIQKILQQADSNSLVLMDEIGTGTDPAEGSALGTAVLIQLKNINATALASTHHGSLKLIANELDGFENASMEFDLKNLQPTYNFKQGIPGSSYAFEVAKRIGFTDKFLEIAKEYLDTDKHKLENFLVDIESKARQADEKLKKTEIENTRLSELTNLYQQKIDNLDKEKKEILKKTKEEASNYLSEINKKFEKIVKELKESNAKPEIIKSSQKVIKEAVEKNENLFEQDVELNDKLYNFAIGNYAAIKNTETSGKIIDFSKDKKSVILDSGSLKIKVKLKDLVPAKKGKEKIEHNTINFPSVAGDANTRIDIRGNKPEEIEFEVLKFLDNAYSAGIQRVEILHGKGTGALKKTVHDLLKQHDKVKNYYFAPVEFGGEGITIAELK